MTLSSFSLAKSVAEDVKFLQRRISIEMALRAECLRLRENRGGLFEGRKLYIVDGWQVQLVGGNVPDVHFVAIFVIILAGQVEQLPINLHLFEVLCLLGEP